MICLARKRIWIQNPYFIPEPEAIDAFGRAVKRGVDVRVLMPATSGSDNPMVQHAGHRNFEKLLKCGVRLFEYPHTLLHQKVMTVDGVWSAVGSSNFETGHSRRTTSSRSGSWTRPPRQARRHLRKVPATMRGDRTGAMAQPGLWHKLKDNAFYMLNEIL